MQGDSISVHNSSVAVSSIDEFKQWLGDKPVAQVNILDEISNFIFTSKYARYNDKLKRRETWNEAVSRVEDMHLRKYNHLPEKDVEKLMWAFDMVRSKNVVPSMRSMQFGGAAVESHNARIFNCAVRHVDSTTAMAEIFYLLLCGCGVGVGMFNKYLAKLPNLIDGSNEKYGRPLRFAVEDTIEGWADSLKILVDSYLVGTDVSEQNIIFDYSLIRPKGSPLKTGGGKAPGSEGLRHSHTEIKKLLERSVGYDRLRSIDVYDILMHAADAVLSGGVRRAATSIMFSIDDKLMMEAKTGNWFQDNPQRARSNNSVLLMRDMLTREGLKEIIQHTKEWGEPGFVLADHPDTLFNPCFEISFIPVDENGECGVQFCNLTSINGTKIDSMDKFRNAVEAATIIGTLQASYTEFPYLSSVAKKLTESESLLGVSITAMMDHPEVILDDDYQAEGAKLATAVNKEWAEKLGINQAARVTCVKPEGTSTLVLGSMASGIHPSHSRYMFRRVQMNKLDTVYQFFKKFNPHLCEESVWNATKSDDVVTFPVKIPDTAMVKADLTALKHLDIIKNTQKNWVINGTTEANKKPLTHNVSCTVICKDDEWDDVGNYLFDNRHYFSAVSLLSDTGDKQYAQVPMEEIKTTSDAALWVHHVNHYIPVDYTQLIETEDITAVQDTVACGGGACEIDWTKMKEKSVAKLAVQ